MTDIETLIERVSAASGKMDLSELTSRIANATGADPTLDLDICAAFLPEGCGPVTASLSAVVALVKRELPGWIISITIGHGDSVAYLRDKSIVAPDVREFMGGHRDEERALLLALMRALSR